ncbi:MAG: phosphotransferase [Caldilineaceae bacterium]|nr:phosphotransferase [Caldilineaceae bacterium]
MNPYLGAAQLAQPQAILTSWDIPPVITIAQLQEGHTVFKITTTGPTFMLKKLADRPDRDRLAFTRNVLTHVERSGLRVPVPLLTRSGETAAAFQDRFYLLSPFIESDDYPQEPEAKAELFYATGRALAKLHQALAAYPAQAIQGQTWREALSGRVAEWLAALGSGLPEVQAASVQRVAIRHGAAIEGALAGLPEQLIHRDCHPGNLLIQGMRVIGFIDWDDLCIGPRLFDLAYYAAHQLKMAVDESARQAWLVQLPHLLVGYRAQQPLLPKETRAFPYCMMAYHLLLAHWLMGKAQQKLLEREVAALGWLHQHFAAISAATMAS